MSKRVLRSLLGAPVSPPLAHGRGDENGGSALKTLGHQTPALLGEVNGVPDLLQNWNMICVPTIDIGETAPAPWESLKTNFNSNFPHNRYLFKQVYIISSLFALTFFFSSFVLLQLVLFSNRQVFNIPCEINVILAPHSAQHIHREGAFELKRKISKAESCFFRFFLRKKRKRMGKLSVFVVTNGFL